MSMFYIKKIFQLFFMPSTFLLLFLAIGLFLLSKGKRKMGKWLIIAGTACYYFFSIAPVSNFLLKGLENQFPSLLNGWKIKQVSTIVVLGSGLNPNPKWPLSSQLSPSSALHVLEAVRLYKLMDDPKVVMSGGNAYGKEKESLLMAELAISLGVPREHIICEQKSRDTRENAEEVKKILVQDHFLLITSASALPRTIAVFRKLGMNPIPVPVEYRAGSSKGYRLRSFFPYPDELKKSDAAFHEYLGLLWYRLRGYL